MANWEFDSAQAAMATAKQIIDSRDSIAKLIPDLSLDGTVLQNQFESAETQTNLDGLLSLIKKEADAATRVDWATRLSNRSPSILESIGLLGTDVQTPLAQAKADLANVKPETASTSAQRVIDSIDKSRDQGLLRAGSVAGIVALLLLLLGLIVFLRRRTDAWSDASQWPQGGWEQPGLENIETPQVGAWTPPPTDGMGTPDEGPTGQ
jgi:hypothetical protein